MKFLFILLLIFPLHYYVTAQTVNSGSSVVIGRQEWMTENLSVDHYNDGTPIPEAKTIEQWKAYNDNRIGCYCYYDNEPCYGKMYGKLYNWYAIKKGIAPHCWKVPVKQDYDRLIAYLGGDQAGKKLKAKHSWSNDWNGSNTSGFGGFAGGCRNPSGTFSYVGREGFWWTCDARKTGNDRGAGLHLLIDYDDKCSYDISEDFGYSVRCMRDVGEPSPEPCP